MPKRYQPTLAEVLEANGFAHSEVGTPEPHCAQEIEVTIDDEVLFTGTPVAVWAWLIRMNKAEIGGGAK